MTKNAVIYITLFISFLYTTLAYGTPLKDELEQESSYKHNQRLPTNKINTTGHCQS